MIRLCQLVAVGDERLVQEGLDAEQQEFRRPLRPILIQHQQGIDEQGYHNLVFHAFLLRANQMVQAERVLEPA